MNKAEGVTLRCGLRDAKKWFAGVRGRKVADPFDSRRRKFQVTIAAGHYLDIVGLWPEVAEHRVYFGDAIDVPVDDLLEAALSQRT